MLVNWMGDQERVDAGLPQQVRGEFHLVDSPCQWDPKCPKREPKESVAKHQRRKKQVDPARGECPCGELWRAELDADDGVLAARFKLEDGRLPDKVVEVLQKDRRFNWDWTLDKPLPPRE